MSLPIILRSEDVRDLETARDWYDLQRAGLGDTFAARAADALDAIENSPELYGTVWHDIRAAPIR